MRTWLFQWLRCSVSSQSCAREISDSASPRATLAPSANLNKARLKALRASIDSTRAVSDIELSLFEILLDQGRFLREKLHMLMRRLEKIRQRLGGVLEGFAELMLLLIAPSGLQAAELGVQTAHQP